MTVPLLWFLCVLVWSDMTAADNSQPKRYLTMLRMGKRTERSALTDVEGDDLNDEQYIILYPGRSTPGSSSDRTRQAFFKVPRVGRRSTTAQHSDLAAEKEHVKRKAAGYGFDDVNLPMLYDEY